MNTAEYREARKDLGYDVADWIKTLGIAWSTHRKYASGERQIPVYVAAAIELLRERDKLKREKLIRDYKETKAPV